MGTSPAASRPVSLLSASTSFTGARWSSLPVPADHLEWLRTNHPRLSPIAARCLAIRWGNEPRREGWLTPSVEQLHDPHAMTHMDAAVDRLRRAAGDKQRIRVVTDYDVDGTTSSLILQAALRLTAPELDVDYHIPDRFTEGYGFSVAAADAAADAGIHLVVTADIGVRDHKAVARARERGVDVLVCDHHLPEGAAVPDGAIVLCPPQVGCGYPNRALAACGISLKVAQALLARHPKRDAVVRSMLKLAAIGTVADLVPLTTAENRAIVALGLAELNRGGHGHGLQALLTAARLDSVDETDLGYRIGPRINAAGRVADAKLVVRLLTSRDPAEAAKLAAEIEHHNTERKALQDRLVERVLAELSAGEPDPFVVVAGPEHEGFHRGVVGIVAARVKEVFHRPAAVVSIQGDRAVGSIRSVPGVHAVRALDSARDLLEKYGGHPVAAGFTVPTDRLDELRRRLSAFVRAEAAPDALDHVLEVDAWVAPGDLGEALLADLQALGPFGQGNPRPRLVLRGVRPTYVEARPKMLKFGIPRPGGASIEGIWWSAPIARSALEAGPVDLYGELSEHRWNGSRRLRFTVADARVSSEG